MSNINAVTLTGRLTADPKIQDSPKCGMFTLAVNSYYKSGSKWRTKTSYIFCKGWGFLADTIKKLSKGQMIALLGTLESYAKEQQTYTLVNVRRLEILPVGKAKDIPEETVEEEDPF